MLTTLKSTFKISTYSNQHASMWDVIAGTCLARMLGQEFVFGNNNQE